MDPTPPTRAHRARRALTRLLTGITLLAVLGPPLQVLAVRWITPPLTLTMLDSAWTHQSWPETSWWTEVPAWHGPVGRAVVASEDGWFFVHDGFDPSAIADALKARKAGTSSRGASTLSQQVARNAFLWQGRSWLRKGLEAGYTVLLELLVPKERILELYLQLAQTGPNTYGFDAGARRWFGKAGTALTLTEAAQLAAILPKPSSWNPRGSYATERAALTLQHAVPFPTERGFDQLVQRGEQRLSWDQVWDAL
jgi:monofunctional biosynthetic peptidoglycan transglycosylase